LCPKILTEIVSMKMELNFVPPGGGETDYAMEADLPAVPRPGDYISVEDFDPDVMPSGFTRDFIVRRTWWRLQIGPKDDAVARTRAIGVECEFARSPYSSEEHKKSCDMYDARSKRHGEHPPVKEFDRTCY
jgi:hypothetical protein